MCWMGMVLMASGAGALYFQGYMNDNLTRNSCRTAELLQEADDAMQTGASLMCSYLCPCNFTPALQVLYAPYSRPLIKGSASQIEDCKPCENLQTLSPAETTKVNEFLLPYGLNIATCRSMTNSQFVDKFFTKKGQMVFPLLTWVEYSFRCAGMCTPTIVYSFTDVNNANPNLPTEPCYAPFNDWVDEKFPIFGGLGVAFGFFSMLMAVLSFTLCCFKRV